MTSKCFSEDNIFAAVKTSNLVFRIIMGSLHNVHEMNVNIVDHIRTSVTRELLNRFA